MSSILGLIGALIASLGLPIGIWLTIKDIRTWERLIKEAGKQSREKELVFVNERELDAEHAGLVATDETEEEEALYWS